MRTCLVVLLFTSCWCSISGFKFSESFKVCRRTDSELDKCLTEAIAAAFKVIGKTGLPSLNVPSIEPLKVSQISIGAGSKAVNLEQHYEDANIHGLSDANVEKAHFDRDNLVITYTSSHPVLRQIAKYKINGKILVLPVFGEGDSIITLKNAVITHKISLKEETKKGKKYYKVTKYEAHIKIDHAHFDFKNLFNGDKLLGDNIQNVVNENWEVVFNDVNDGVDRAYSKVFEEVSNSLLGKIPAEELLPN